MLPALMILSLLVEPTWYKERTNFSKLPSDLHVHVCIGVPVPRFPPNKQINVKKIEIKTFLTSFLLAWALFEAYLCHWPATLALGLYFGDGYSEGSSSI